MNISLCTSPHLNHSVFHNNKNPRNGPPVAPAQRFAPMGLISIASAAAGVAESVILDINEVINSDRLPMSSEFYEVAAEWLLESDPDLVGFMTEADSYHHVIRILQTLKARAPTVTTLLGGVHATAVHQETLAHFPAIDFIIRGESELAFPAFVEALADDRPFTSVGNLTYRDRGLIRSNPEMPLIQDLDMLPWPDCSRFRLSQDDAVYVEVGRGCPFKCSFCFTAPYWHRRHRIKSAERLLNELRYFRDNYSRTDFNFTHDLFTTDRRWVLEFCRKLVESDIDVTWTCSSRTDTLDEEQIHWMARAGCRNIYFGVEAGTAEMQAAILKNLDIQEARRIIGLASEAGIGITVGFIAGLPGENVDTLTGTLTEAFHYLRLPESTVHVFGFSPYSGSPNFSDIRSKLRFDPHFLDFALPKQLHLRNCEWMQQHFEIFFRYSTLPSNDLSIEIVRAAGEFFPIVNGVPRLFKFASVISEPVALVHAWASWIAEVNRRRGRAASGLYQGTIDDFLEFLPSYLEGRGVVDPVIAEYIRWECMKRAVPQVLEDSDGAFDQPANASRGNVYTNPSVSMDSFQYPHVFLDAAEGAGPGTFAFYTSPQGDTRIVRLPPLGALALQVAEGGVDRKNLIEVLSPNAGARLSGGSDIVAAMLEEFERVGLVLSV